MFNSLRIILLSGVLIGFSSPTHCLNIQKEDIMDRVHKLEKGSELTLYWVTLKNGKRVKVTFYTQRNRYQAFIVYSRKKPAELGVKESLHIYIQLETLFNNQPPAQGPEELNLENID